MPLPSKPCCGSPGIMSTLRNAPRSNAPAPKIQTDPHVWSGRASQEHFVDLSALRSCINVAGLCLERVVLRAIMDVSARAVSLADRPRTGHVGQQGSHAPERPVLHLVSSSRRPRRETGIGDYVIAVSLSLQFLCSCYEAVPSSRPAHPGGGARRGCQGWPLFAATRRAWP